MANNLPVHFGKITPQTSAHHPAESMRVDGNPQRITSEYFSARSHGVRTGLWESEVGAYRIEFPHSKHEVFHVLAGEIHVTADGGDDLVFKAGDTGVLPAGFRGVFRIVEHARKVYTVTEHVSP
jgi:uncharacterized cupin superfamily protein